MIIKRNMAVDSLTKVCEESLSLIKQLIDADNEVYGKGFEDGMAAQAKIRQTLRPWVELTEDEIPDIYVGDTSFLHGVKWAEAKLKEKNT